MSGGLTVTVADVKAIARPVLRHRIVTTFNADSRGISCDDVVDQLLETIPDHGEEDEIPAVIKGALKTV